MSDPTEHLRATLQELHQELESISTVDDQTRQMLRQAADEIRRSLDTEGEAPPLPDPSMGEQLAESARAFQSSHPTLARLIGNVLDALGQIGI